MVTEIRRELLIGDLVEVEQPNSIMHLASAYSEEFGWYPDERPIFDIARIVPDENSGDKKRAKIELVGDVWKESGATDTQLGRIRVIFRNFFFKAQTRGIIVDESYTIGQLRQDCQNHKIRTIPGLWDTAEDFLTQVVRKRTLQVLPGGVLS
ncbi:MAG: hypothetical protein ABSE17_03590 [Candidatus Levyibacteriota bacterium]|jgi:hypothetical protein